MGINRNKWYKNNWKENENLRKIIVEPLLKLKQEIDKEKSAKNISEKCVTYSLIIPEKCDTLFMQ